MCLSNGIDALLLIRNIRRRTLKQQCGHREVVGVKSFDLQGNGTEKERKKNREKKIKIKREKCEKERDVRRRREEFSDKKGAK